MPRLAALALTFTGLSVMSAAAATPRLRFEETADARVMLAGRLLPDTQITAVDVRAVGGGPWMRFVGARSDAPLVGELPLQGVSHDLRHATSTARAADRHHFAQVRVRGAWPGIDVVYRENAGELKHDFVVAAGADAKRIRVAFPGASRVSVGADGVLIAHGVDGELQLKAPIAWQEGASGREPVACAWRLRGERATFAIGEHDARRELVIDPEIAWSTYIGGPRVASVHALAVNPDGSVIVVISGAEVPTTPGAYSADGGRDEVAVACLSSDGSTIQWATYAPGMDAHARVLRLPDGTIALGSEDNEGTAPVVGGMDWAGEVDIYLAVLSADGASLVVSGYFGGPGVEGLTSLSRAPNGDFVLGCYAELLPSLFQAETTIGSALAGSFGLVLRVSADLSSILHSTLIGGSIDGGPACAAVVPVDGSIVIAMSVNQSDDGFPTLNAVQPVPAEPDPTCALATDHDVYLARLSPDGSQLMFATFLGGGCADSVASVAADAAGEIVVAGRTNSRDFPTVDAVQRTYGGGQTDMFLARFSPAGGLVSSTYLGGSRLDLPGDAAFDEGWRLLLAGQSDSPDYPRVENGGLPDAAPAAGTYDAVVSRFDIDGGLEFSTTLGGDVPIYSPNRWNQALAVASTGDAILFGGMTTMADYPTTPGSALEQAPFVPSGLGAGPSFSGFVTSISGTISRLTEVSAIASNPAMRPLTIRDDGPRLILGWEETTGGPEDVDARIVVYLGTLASLHVGRYDHVPAMPCSFLRPPADIDMPPGDVYVLVGRAKDDESSLGTDSFGRERPHPRSPCP